MTSRRPHPGLFILIVLGLLAGAVGLAGSAHAAAGDVLNLSRWKLTVDVDLNRDGKADEFKQPALNSYNVPNKFDTVNGVTRMRVLAGGATTSGSGYPRVEFREMNADGSNAAWDSRTGTHRLFTQFAVTALPPVKPHIVVGQIHNSSDDVLMVRLERNRLFVERNGDEVALLTSSYQLGTVATYEINTAGGVTRVLYNGVVKYTTTLNKSGLYFKAGAYLQSSPAKGESPTAFGEVLVYGLRLIHQ